MGGGRAVIPPSPPMHFENLKLVYRYALRRLQYSKQDDGDVRARMQVALSGVDKKNLIAILGRTVDKLAVFQPVAHPSDEIKCCFHL